MSKQIYEFDYLAQDPGLTQSQLEASINLFKDTQALASLQVHQKRTTTSKKLIEGFVTWGEGELDQNQLTALDDILAAQFGLVGYTPAIPDPPSLAQFGNLDDTAGIVSTMVLPTVSGLAFSSFVVQVVSSTGSGSTIGAYWDIGAGMVYLDANPTLAPQLTNLMVQFVVREQNPANYPLAVTLAAATPLKLVGNAGAELVLTRTNDLVMTANATVNNTVHLYWLDDQGKMYLALKRDGLTGTTAFRTFEEATAFAPL